MRFPPISTQRSPLRRSSYTALSPTMSAASTTTFGPIAISPAPERAGLRSQPILWERSFDKQAASCSPTKHKDLSYQIRVLMDRTVVQLRPDSDGGLVDSAMRAIN